MMVTGVMIPMTTATYDNVEQTGLELVPWSKEGSAALGDDERASPLSQKRWMGINRDEEDHEEDALK
jgi:hypothetical protein